MRDTSLVLDEYPNAFVNQMNCVGCEACMKICPKKCYTHEAMTVEGG